MPGFLGYGTGDIRALQSGWTTVAPDIRVQLFDDAVQYIAKVRGYTGSSVKIKNVAIEIPNKWTDENGKRTVEIAPKVDMVLLGYYSGRDYRVLIMRKAGETLIPENVFWTNRPSVTPIVLLKDETYQFKIDTGGLKADVDLVLIGVQVGEFPTDLVQYNITSDTGSTS